jgi:hypothetical protein
MLKRFRADLLILTDFLFYYFMMYFPGPTSDSFSMLNLLELENEMPGSDNLGSSLK